MPMLSTRRHNAGDQYRVEFSLRLPNPYVTGGVPITVGDLGLAQSAQIEFVMVPGPQNGGFYQWIPETGRLQAFMLSGGALAEVPNNTDLSSFTVRGYAHGI